MNSLIEEIWSSLYTSNPHIKALAVIESSTVIWQTSNWNVVEDGPTIVEMAKNEVPTVTLAGIDYSHIESSEDYYVATAGEKGHLLVSNVDKNRSMVAWAAPDSDPGLAIVDLQYHAISLGKQS